MKKRKHKKQFIFLWGNGRKYQDYMCEELKKYKNVFVINNSTDQTWQEKHTEIIEKYNNEIVGEWRFRRWCIKELNLKKDRINYLIFSEDYFLRIDREVFRKLCEEFKIKSVLYVNDPIRCRMNLKRDKLTSNKKKVDLIITTDREDARRYGIAFSPLFYSKVFDNKTNKVEYDICFIGRDKGRGKLINKIKNEAEKNGLIAKFFLKDADVESMHDIWVRYEDVLNIVRKSNCLLEVLQENQSGISLRTMEAVMFNKKLITNNKDIVNYPFYDKRYIQVFTKIEDLDFNFIKERIEVSYNYNGECSPIHFLKKVVKLLQ
jgi:hypothetical protein